MFDCLTKRRLSKVDDSIPVFSLNNYRGYARITSVYDGDTFKACIILHGQVRKFIFRTLGYDAPEMKPRLIIDNRDQYIQDAILAREMFKEELGFDSSAPHQWWNPFMCRNKVNGWVWIECYANDKYGRTLVNVFKTKPSCDIIDPTSVNDIMINSGLVNPYDGKTKKQFI